MTETDLVRQYEKLIRASARSFRRTNPSYELEDLEQEARLALVKAARSNKALYEGNNYRLAKTCIENGLKNRTKRRLLSTIYLVDHEGLDESNAVGFAAGQTAVVQLRDRLRESTPEESRVLMALIDGQSMKEVSRRLKVPFKTVEQMRASVLGELKEAA